ncbi:MAG: putative ABC transport system substrate-binding protein [Gammaproteobacteria bacterium]|jgi:putative ABC transport system substrate-binding protein
MYPFLSNYSDRKRAPCLTYAVTTCFILSLWWTEIACAGQKITIITSSDLPAYQLAAAELGRQLAENGMSSSHPTDFWLLDDVKAKSATAAMIEREDVVVTVGSAAADYAVHHFVSSRIVCSFITRNAFDVITADASPDNAITAVFIDQPIKRLIQISTLLRKDQSVYKIGMLSQSVLAEPSLAIDASAANNDIEINSTSLLLTGNPIKQIEPLMKNSDVFIVRPNTSLFNRLVAKLVLQLSMRYKTPVIGFSEKYAKAGALLSVYASPENIGWDTGLLLSEWMQDPSNATPVPRDGSEFSLVINQRIARKLSITLDAEQLKSTLQKMEGK